MVVQMAWGEPVDWAMTAVEIRNGKPRRKALLKLFPV